MDYVGGEMETWPKIDEDWLDVFNFEKFSAKLGYCEGSKVSWLVPNANQENGLRHLKVDNDLLEMVAAARMNEGKPETMHELLAQPEPLHVVLPKHVQKNYATKITRKESFGR
ncbi:hypothetical protein RJT34_09418 [Clitoria ternatea]|uniref:PB1-like domain-containing protein n=1 Tax=Clitoria ternatea TaxID=43366 RepID=A0AAN9PWC8_CLITE